MQPELVTYRQKDLWCRVNLSKIISFLLPPFGNGHRSFSNVKYVFCHRSRQEIALPQCVFVGLLQTSSTHGWVKKRFPLGGRRGAPVRTGRTCRSSRSSKRSRKNSGPVWRRGGVIVQRRRGLFPTLSPWRAKTTKTLLSFIQRIRWTQKLWESTGDQVQRNLLKPLRDATLAAATCSSAPSAAKRLNGRRIWGGTCRLTRERGRTAARRAAGGSAWSLTCRGTWSPTRGRNLTAAPSATRASRAAATCGSTPGSTRGRSSSAAASASRRSCGRRSSRGTNVVAAPSGHYADLARHLGSQNSLLSWRREAWKDCYFQKNTPCERCSSPEQAAEGAAALKCLHGRTEVAAWERMGVRCFDFIKRRS